MKKNVLQFSLFAVFMSLSNAVLACDVCAKNQPKGLENITHGPGPTQNFDYIISWVAVVIVAVALFYSIKLLVKPKEGNPDHIKNIVLNKSLGI